MLNRAQDSPPRAPASDSRRFQTLARVAAAARRQTRPPPTLQTTWPRFWPRPLSSRRDPPVWTRLWSRPQACLFRPKHLHRQNQQASGVRCCTSYSPAHCCRHARRSPPRGRGSQLRGKYYHRPHPFPRLSGRLGKWPPSSPCPSLGLPNSGERFRFPLRSSSPLGPQLVARLLPAPVPARASRCLAASRRRCGGAATLRPTCTGHLIASRFSAPAWLGWLPRWGRGRGGNKIEVPADLRNGRPVWRRV